MTKVMLKIGFGYQDEFDEKNLNISKAELLHGISISNH